MWCSKIGNTGATLRLGLRDRAGLLTFASIVGPGGSGAPQLRMRHAVTGVVVSRDVVSLTGNTVYNAQVEFTDFEGILPGEYDCEVDAFYDGHDIAFPQCGFFRIRFGPSLD